jgi:hypothetical protein
MLNNKAITEFTLNMLQQKKHHLANELRKKQS